MATYYVRKNGNDSTGDGSTGNPWLTIHKALTTVSLAGNHTINVGNGTYAETSGNGYLLINQLFAAPVVVQSESGNRADVTITGATTYAILISAATNVTLRNMTISPNSGLIYNIRLNGASQNITLDGVALTMEQANGRMIHFGATATNVTIQNCTMVQVGTNDVYGIFASNVGCNNLVVSNCTVSVFNRAIWFRNAGCTGMTFTNSGFQTFGTDFGAQIEGVNDLVIHGCSFKTNGGIGAVALCVGADAEYGGGVASSGIKITSSTIDSLNSHGLLIGSGAKNGFVANSVILGGDQGVVLKGCDGVSVFNCAIRMRGGGRAAYFKTARNSTFHHNTIVAEGGFAISAENAQNCSFLYNTVQNVAGDIYRWSGTNTFIESNYNHYIVEGARWGNPNGAVCITLAQVRAAWVGDEFELNDQYSNQLRLEA